MGLWRSRGGSAAIDTTAIAIETVAIEIAAIEIAAAQVRPRIARESGGVW